MKKASYFIFAGILINIGLQGAARAATLAGPPSGTDNVDPDAAVITWTTGTFPNGDPETKSKVFLSLAEDPNDVGVYVRNSGTTGSQQSATFNSLRPDVTYYWKVDGLRDAAGSNAGTQTWSFKTKGVDPANAIPVNPAPTPMPSPQPRAPEEMVFLGTLGNGQADNVLRWQSGTGGVSANLYFGKHSNKPTRDLRGNFNPVSGTYSCSMGILEPGTRYYWSVDTVDSNGNIIKKGRIWDFWTGSNANFSGTDTVLFSDEFENGGQNTDITDPAHNPLGWAKLAGTTSAQIRNAGRASTKCVKLGGATSISKLVNTEGMGNIRVTYYAVTSGSAHLYLDWTANSGTTWFQGTSVQANATYGSTPRTLSIASVSGTGPANQPGFGIRFRTTNTSSSEYAYVDGVQVLGQVQSFPVCEPRDVNATFYGQPVIVLGDSLTNNSATPATHNGDDHWTGMIEKYFRLSVNFDNLDADGDKEVDAGRHDNLGKGGSVATLCTTFSGTYPEGTYDSQGGLERLVYEIKWRKETAREGHPLPKFVIINFGMNDHKVYPDGANEGKGEVKPRAVITEATVSGTTDEAAFEENMKKIVKEVQAIPARAVLVIPHNFYEGPIPGGDINNTTTAVANRFLDSYYCKFAPRLFGESVDALGQPKTFTDYYVSNGVTKSVEVTPTGDGGALNRFERYLKRIRHIAAVDTEVDLIDLNKAAAEYDAADFTIDGGVHLTDLGHRVYARTIETYLSQRYPGPTPTPSPSPSPTP